MKYLNTVKYLRNFIKSLMKNEECAKRRGSKSQNTSIYTKINIFCLKMILSKKKKNRRKRRRRKKEDYVAVNSQANRGLRCRQKRHSEDGREDNEMMRINGTGGEKRAELKRVRCRPTT